MNLLFFMTLKQDVVFVYEDWTVRQALEKMEKYRYSTVPVLARDGRYVGTLTEGDLLWGIRRIQKEKNLEVEEMPLSGIPRRRDYEALLPIRILYRWWTGGTTLSAWCGATPSCSIFMTGDGPRVQNKTAPPFSPRKTARAAGPESTGYSTAYVLSFSCKQKESGPAGADKERNGRYGLGNSLCGRACGSVYLLGVLPVFGGYRP